ncbi:MAG TPA: NAD(P)-dependent alcohol dehydrogenase [Actinomycetales bacterium]|nr:NAD(P)-dependent alcohol dehydrogenase [Actinomycetales bacterium]
MRAVVQDRYGSADVLQVRDVDTPVVGDDEVLVRVRAASVHPDVWHVVSGRPYVLRLMGSGLRRPKNRVPGTDVAGQVEVVGRNVTRLRPGDEVFGETVTGYQWHNGGAFAEYVSVPQDSLALKPANITLEQAAAVPTSGLIALHNLRQGRLQPGQRVLVNGAGGGVGAFAVQLATAQGATVTGVDAARKLDMVRSLGAAHVIDFTQEDFTQAHQSYHLIFDVVGNHSFRECRRALTPDGSYVLIGHDGFGDAAGRWLGSLPRVLGLVAMSPFMSQLPPIDFSLPAKKDSMAVLTGHLEAGELTPVIDRTFSLNEVAEALRYLQTGQALGKIIISI